MKVNMEYAKMRIVYDSFTACLSFMPASLAREPQQVLTIQLTRENAPQHMGECGVRGKD